MPWCFVLAPACRASYIFVQSMKIPFALTALVFLSGVTVSQGALIASHTGSNDPATEGFLLSDSTAVAGAVTGDLGRNAWSVDSSGGPYNHRFNVGTTAANDANTNGWILSMTLRLVDVPDTMDLGVCADYASDEGIFQLGFGTQADGDPIVGLYTDSGFTTFAYEGGGTGYHTYEITYSPVSDSATLSIDGIVRLSGWAGRSGPAPPITNFGSYASGHANWSEFSFSSIPEPAAGLLAGVACCLGASRRRRASF